MLEKIRHNSHRNHSTRSASKHREMDYVSKRNFGTFLGQLKESFDLVFSMLDDAFRRDTKIAQNLLES